MVNVHISACKHLFHRTSAIGKDELLRKMPWNGHFINEPNRIEEPLPGRKCHSSLHFFLVLFDWKKWTKVSLQTTHTHSHTERETQNNKKKINGKPNTRLSNRRNRNLQTILNQYEPEFFWTMHFLSAVMDLSKASLAIRFRTKEKLNSSRFRCTRTMWYSLCVQVNMMVH